MSQKQDIFTVMGGMVKFYPSDYNPTSDAVWLGAFPKSAKCVLDVGIGNGGAALCYLAHNTKTVITGIDVSKTMLDQCYKNTQLNDKNIELLNADIFNWKTNRTFDLVITNPPYFKGTPAKHGAHHNVNISEWIESCIKRVRPRGYFCTIIDSLVVSEVISVLSKKFGEITIFPLFGAKNTAERVLISARQSVKGGTKLFSGLSMNYKPVLRDGLTIWEALDTLHG
ncbi:MAG TPA: methyltransferase [Alphaproteobacteria bacterium]|nr:methyltransferase [Alphaproteobacteria bacterium]